MRTIEKWVKAQKKDESKHFAQTKNPFLRKITTVMLVPTLIFIGIFTFSNCEKLRNLRLEELVEAVKEELMPKCENIVFSECGMSLEENEEDSVLLVDTITETTFGDLRILYKGAHLHFTHHEIGLNCAHTQVDVALSIVSDTIEVNIVETPWGMNCICYVDVSYSIGKIERGMYELIIRYRNNIRYSQTINF